MVRVVATVAVLGVAVALASVALAAQSPKALRTAIFAAAKKHHSLHYVEQGTAPGLVQIMVTDVGAKRGVQNVSFTLKGKKGQSEKGQFTVRVVKPLVYLRADEVAMRDFLGFTAAQATTYHGNWIVVRPGQHRYKDLAASVTMSSFLHDIYPSAPLAIVKTSIGGHKFTGVSGTNKAGGGIKLKMAVFPDSKKRPFAVADVDRRDKFVDVLKISRWNEAVHVQAPANSVPITTVESG